MKYKLFKRNKPDFYGYQHDAAGPGAGQFNSELACYLIS